jgi:hypothetical protein
MAGALVAVNVFATIFYTRNGGYGLLDLGGGRNATASRPGFTPDDVYALMSAWGPGGRRGQMLFTLTGDVLLPLTVFAFTALALRYGATRLGAPGWSRSLLLIPPTAYLLSDYLENAAIVTLVAGYPTRLDGLAAVLEWAHIVKDATSAFAMLAVLITLALVALLRGRTRRLRPDPAGPAI